MAGEAGEEGVLKRSVPVLRRDSGGAPVEVGEVQLFRVPGGYENRLHMNDGRTYQWLYDTWMDSSGRQRAFLPGDIAAMLHKIKNPWNPDEPDVTPANEGLYLNALYVHQGGMMKQYEVATKRKP